MLYFTLHLTYTSIDSIYNAPGLMKWYAPRTQALCNWKYTCIWTIMHYSHFYLNTMHVLMNKKRFNWLSYLNFPKHCIVMVCKGKNASITVNPAKHDGPARYHRTINDKIACIGPTTTSDDIRKTCKKCSIRVQQW